MTRKKATPASPEPLTNKQEFGRRLQALILERNWNQAELARAAGLGRDSISTYIKGLVFPDPKNLKKVADALGMTPQQLMPTGMVASIDAEIPALEIRQSSTDPDRVHIRVNRLVSLEQASQIFAILKDN